MRTSWTWFAHGRERDRRMKPTIYHSTISRGAEKPKRNFLCSLQTAIFRSRPCLRDNEGLSSISHVPPGIATIVAIKLTPPWKENANVHRIYPHMKCRSNFPPAYPPRNTNFGGFMCLLPPPRWKNRKQLPTLRFKQYIYVCIHYEGPSSLVHVS